MEFTKRKLSHEMVGSLCKAEISTVQPFALMIGPTYVYLKENHKFVSVKAPLDFFTPPELDRLIRFEYFYFPTFVASVVPVRDAAQAVKKILSLEEKKTEATFHNPYPQVVLPPAPFEISDNVLRIIGELWWEYPKKEAGIEPFWVTVFVNELCDLIPSEILMAAREKSVERFEQALIHSSWVVFLALHLGYCDLDFLNHIRMSIIQAIPDFESASSKYLTGYENVSWVQSISSFGEDSEINELIMMTAECLGQNSLRVLKGSFFKGRIERAAQKIMYRLERIKNEFLSSGSIPPTIFGARGIIDV